MEWNIEYTDEFGHWWDSLTVQEQDSIDAAVEILEEVGPALGRPLVDSIQGSRHSNMKELRPRSGNIRILFAFDPRRSAKSLIGGDKTNRWSEWYFEMIPIADQLYDDYFYELQREGKI